MIGIEDIGVYIPPDRSFHSEKKSKFNIDDDFLEKKLGITQVSVKKNSEQASGMAVRAFEALAQKCGLDRSALDCLIVVTQNPDYGLPHTSAIVHGALGLPLACACFDLSLGCSGFVYGLSVIESFMEKNDLSQGVLITSDPYSGIVDADDKNTALLFGDAATAALITRTPRYVSGKYVYGTLGKSFGDLIKKENRLFMNGRSIFDFAARQVPISVRELAKKNSVDLEQVDKFIFHQASSYIHQTITARLGIDPRKAPFEAREYGNTVSSSIPILLERECTDAGSGTIAICGFGVGLSWACGMLFKAKR